MAGPELTPELLAQLESHVAFWETLTVNRGEGALFGHGGQLNGFFHHFEFLADALPALVAAAKERDQLRASLADKEEEIGQLSEMLGPSQIDRANLRDQVDQLQAEVERLRGLGLDATEILHAAIDGEPWAEQFEIKRGLLRAQIERKP